VTRIIAALAFVVLVGQNSTDPKDTSPHTEHFVKANGVNLHYLDWGGEGEPLVLVTGYGTTAHTFDDFAPQLIDRFHVVSFTRKGTNPSERTTSGYDLATLTSDLEAFLDVLGLRRVHLAGHSFGGTEMTELATLHPERVISLVYIDAALDLAAGEIVMKDPVVSLPQPQPGSPYAQVLAWSRSYTPDFSRLKSPALAFYTTQVPIPVPRNVSDDVRRQIDEFSRTKWIPLVLRMAEKFRSETNGQTVIMENVSHYIFRDRRDEVVRDMQNFYASIKR
jgi:pimeloyl-ACP methyl ester carboxylesterase